MHLNSIEVSNFRSFSHEKINFNNFNVIIGSNAAGKSNFISILKFLHDISVNGLDNAISMQGGIEFIRNINIGSSKNLELKVDISLKEGSRGFILPILEKKGENLKKIRITYKIEIEFLKKKHSFKGCKEEIAIEYSSSLPKKRERTFSIILYNNKGKINSILNSQYDDIKSRFNNELDSILKRLYKQSIPNKSSILNHPEVQFLFSLELTEFLNNIKIYDFDPRLSKKAVMITGKSELEHDGSNLAIIIKRITENKKDLDKLSKLINDLLPFVERVSVEKLMDKSLLATIRETYSTDKSIPASIISDGTINVTAMILALHFERHKLVVFEEPERNIHPSLLSKVIDFMIDVSENTDKQIIITTHNPEVVKSANIKDLVLISRDKEGFSKISRPAEQNEVINFLKNDLGIDDLFIQNLLEW